MNIQKLIDKYSNDFNRLKMVELIPKRYLGEVLKDLEELQSTEQEEVEMKTKKDHSRSNCVWCKSLVHNNYKRCPYCWVKIKRNEEIILASKNKEEWKN